MERVVVLLKTVRRRSPVHTEGDSPGEEGVEEGGGWCPVGSAAVTGHLGLDPGLRTADMDAQV